MTEPPRIARALIARFAAQGVRLWVADDQLRYLASRKSAAAADFAELRLHKAAVVEQLIEEGCLTPAYRASEGQKALWFLQQFAGPADVTYNLLAAVDLAAGVDAARLRGALRASVERHEALRTSYRMQFGTLWQIVDDAPEELLDSIDLDGCTEPQLFDEVERYGAQPFDLKRGPVFRARLFERRTEKGTIQRVVAFCAHHIAMDFASLQELLIEIDAQMAQEPLRTARPYREWALREQEGDGELALGPRLDALRERILPLPPAPSLAPLRPNASSPAEFSILQWEPSPAESQASLDAAVRYGITPFALCLAAYGIALSCAFDRDRIAINLAASLPKHADGSVTFGNFANFLPFVAETGAEQRLEDFVRALFKTSHGLLLHHDIPFGKVVEHLGLTGSDPTSPFSQIAFSWHREPRAGARAATRLGAVLPLSRQLGAPGALMLTPRERQGKLDFTLAFAPAKCPPERAEQLLDLFRAVLRFMHRGEDVTLGQLSELIRPRPGPSLSGAEEGRPVREVRLAPAADPAANGGGDLRERLLAILSEILGSKISDTRSSIFDLGLSSITAVELKIAIRKELGRDIPLSEIFRAASIDAISGWMTGRQAKDEEDYRRDLLLPAPDSLPPRRAAHPPRQFLLTGATGFLGTRLLRELLREPEARVLCLVRTIDSATGKEKLRRSLGQYGIAIPDSHWERIELVPGFLGSDRLGLERSAYDRLTRRVEAVLHSAAQVNFSLPYRSLRGNALGALEVARFCMEYKLKPLHFVSSYSVLDPSAARNRETLLVEDHPFLELGYARSKWVAERLLARAAEAGLPCRIYRPSRIVATGPGDRLNGSDFYSLMLAGSVAAGAAPIDAGYDNFVDVEGVAWNIAAAARRPVERSGAVHLCGADWTAWTDILGLLEGAGLSLAPVPYERWVEAVLKAAAGEPRLEPLLNLKSFLEGPADQLRQCLALRHPLIERAQCEDGARLDVTFDRRMLVDHLAQLRPREPRYAVVAS